MPRRFDLWDYIDLIMVFGDTGVSTSSDLCLLVLFDSYVFFGKTLDDLSPEWLTGPRAKGSLCFGCMTIDWSYDLFEELLI